MIASMTSFGRQEQSGDWGSAVWEIRSVNHRYLEISIRMPDDLRSIETRVRERISSRISRGKVDCQLRYQQAAGSGTLQVNTALVAQLVQAAGSLQVKDAPALAPMDLLRWPGVIERPATDMDALSGKLMEMLDTALEAIVQTRQREGAKLKALLRERCTAIKRIIATLRTQLPAILQGLRTRYAERAREMQVELDKERLEQELLFLAQKMDVAEELDRLEAHLQEVERVLEQREPVGRRLDFLMQEMNRESNTLGAKSAALEQSSASVDLKVLIEQMREQVQNIE